MQQNTAVAGNYFTALSAASIGSSTTNPKAETTPVITESMLASPYFMYGAIGIFFAVFLGGILYQIIYRVFDWKRSFTALMLAFTLASLPFGLKLVLSQQTLQSRAGPDEVPREVRIEQTKPGTIHISWQTVAARSGSIRYSRAPFVLEKSTVAIAAGGKAGTSHEIILTNLPAGAYEMEILSGNMWYRNGEQLLQFVVK